MTDEKETLGMWTIVLVCLVALIGLTMLVSGQPQGASINDNFTESSPTNSPSSRSDDGGTINFLELNTLQQNSDWKAYVGNVTGRLTLDDSSGNTIYDWAIASSSIQGEVYVSRNDSVDWSNITCATNSTINGEDTFLGRTSGEVDTLNNTFNYTSHAGMQIGVESVSQDECRSTATYVNDTQQTVNENATFQEILLQDGSSNLVYASFIDQDSSSYKSTNNETYDFQMLVGEDGESGTPTEYFFYLEIS